MKFVIEINIKKAESKQVKGPAKARVDSSAQMKRLTDHLWDKMLKRARVTGRGADRRLVCYESRIKRDTARMRRLPYGKTTYYKAIIDRLCESGKISIERAGMGRAFVLSEDSQ